MQEQKRRPIAAIAFLPFTATTLRQLYLHTLTSRARTDASNILIHY